MSIEIRPVVDSEIEEYLKPITIAFGRDVHPDAIERERLVSEIDLRIGAFDGREVVGSAASYNLRVTVPGGGSVATSWLTRAAVLPTHRRRGILTSMLRLFLDEARRRGQVLSGLFASEGAIYGRYGYGAATLAGTIELPRDKSAFVDGPIPRARVRFVSEEEALPLFAPIWDRVRAVTPGMATRSEGWWRARRISDPEWLRAGRTSLRRVVLEIDGYPRGYALYRTSTGENGYVITGVLDIQEAIADSPEANRALWRWLCDIDFADTIHCGGLPVDHPLFFLLADARQMRMTVHDAVWMRLVDVERALSERAYAGGSSGSPLVLEVSDAFCPWNAGRYLLSGGVATRTDRAPDISLSASALASAYLGGFNFTQLAQAGRIIENTQGALLHADALFRSSRAPWCPEVF
ncbi:MAG TPA: GNAT family N-acetyltransferase [Polyangiaceae bacterium]|nr:GNAT family N-acetyltransferase [Polyangiaceae bacterium]